MTKTSYLRRLALTALFGVGALGVATPALAFDILVSVEGTQQGKFVGESARKGQEQKFVALSIKYEVKAPRDVATGQATGKRAHGPFCMSKAIGAASPQLFQALVTNESLKSVLVEFLRVNQQDGREEVYHTVRLNSASVSSYRLVGDPAGASATNAAKHVAAATSLDVEEVCFSFQGIEIENRAGKTSAVDGTVRAAALKRK